MNVDEDARLPIDNNWLFAGSLRARQRAAAVMSLIQSAKLNGHDSYPYLKDVLARLPTQKNSRIDELLPHNWTPLAIDHVAVTPSRVFSGCLRPKRYSYGPI